MTTALESKVHDFLSQKRIAVVGVSRDNRNHAAANLIYRKLKRTGHEVFAVNPNMPTFDGDRCYPDLKSIPGAVDGAVIVTRPETTQRIVRDCTDAGVRRVWMHQTWDSLRGVQAQRYSWTACLARAARRSFLPPTRASPREPGRTS